MGGANQQDELKGGIMSGRRSTDNFLLFPGVNGDLLADAISRHMEIPLSPVHFWRYKGVMPDGDETKPEIECNVMGQHCVVIWSIKYPNEELMEVCQLIRTLKKQCEARQVTLVAPYFPYARQDKSHGRREPITAKLTAEMLELAGMDRIVYIDIHADQIEGFFSRSTVRGLWMDNIYIDYLAGRFAVLVPRLQVGAQVRAMPPDEGAVAPNYRLAKALQNELAVHLKKRDWSKAHSVTSLGIAGDVVSCLVYTRDDICASGDSLFAAAHEAKQPRMNALGVEQPGAKYVMAIVTHTLGFDKEGVETFVEKLNQSDIDELVTTNTVAVFAQRVLNSPELQKKVSVLDVSPFLAAVLRRLSTGQTIREMMKDVKASDLYRELVVSEKAKTFR